MPRKKQPERSAPGDGLRWTDVDLDRGFLTVRVALERVEGEWRLKG